MPTIKFQPDRQVAYDKVPVQVKVLPGVRDRLKQVPDWQNQVRAYIDSLISGQIE
ncbi:MAG: hypothetical protein WBC69_07110 [Geitlerinemataceae cyanobacterium]